VSPDLLAPCENLWPTSGHPWSPTLSPWSRQCSDDEISAIIGRLAVIHFQQLQQRCLKERSLTGRHPELRVVGERDDRLSGVDVVVDACVVSTVPLRQRPVQPLGHVVRHATIRRVTDEQNLHRYQIINNNN